MEIRCCQRSKNKTKYKKKINEYPKTNYIERELMELQVKWVDEKVQNNDKYVYLMDNLS